MPPVQPSPATGGKPSFLASLSALLPTEIPPLSVYILSNLCVGLMGGAGNLICNSE